MVKALTCLLKAAKYLGRICLRIAPNLRCQRSIKEKSVFALLQFDLSGKRISPRVVCRVLVHGADGRAEALAALHDGRVEQPGRVRRHQVEEHADAARALPEESHLITVDHSSKVS